jgi:hypothetical protein
VTDFSSIRLVTVLTLAAVAAVSALGAGCGGDERCDEAAIGAALAAASSGDVVSVGACEVTGPFTVPAGVTLRGVSADATTVRVADGSRGLTLVTTAGDTTAVEMLRVVSDGCAAIVADGPGGVALRDLSLDVRRGIGVGASSLSALTAERVEVIGAIGETLPASIPMPPYTCATADPATHGIVVVETPDARFTDVTASGFAAFGALFFESDVTWTGGGVSNNVGTGLAIWGGEGELAEMRLCRARQGGLLVESYNGLFAGSASVATRALTVCDSEAFGLMHAGATATHDDLTVTDNAFAGVWTQDSASFAVGGTSSTITDSGFGGIVAFETRSVQLDNLRVEGTTTRTTAAGPITIRAGDGVHIAGSTDITVTSLTATDNERVGLLLDLGGTAPTRLNVTATSVDGAAESLGAIAQNGDVPADWDRDVTRLGTTLANDTAFTGLLDIVGAIGPSCLPDPTSLAASGFNDLVGR